MPQGSCGASLLVGKMPRPQAKYLLEANAALRRLLAHDIQTKILPIPLHRLRLVTFADSGLGNAGGGKSQTAHMMCAANTAIHEGKDSEISILTCNSHKMTRVGSATFFLQSNALSEALAEGEWVAFWFGLAKYLTYDLRCDTTFINLA